jgi:hypothetical protein
MQINYDSITLTPPAIITPPVKPIPASRTARQPRPALALVEARRQALQSGWLEQVAWVAVAVGAAGVLLLSLWL